MASSATLYSPLDEEASQIRLLEIAPQHNDNQQTFSCRTRTVSLNDNVKFFALSYVWGDPNGRIDVVVNGIVIPVTRNLEAALRHIQRNGRTLIVPESRREKTDGHPNPDQAPINLWVDAVCINQNDLKERESQVLLMRRIYSSAETVLAWLGDNDYTDVFEAFEALSTEIRRRTLADQEVSALLEWVGDLELFRDKNIWANIAKFLMHPYWSRIWILQEVVLARWMVLVTRSGSFAWDTVASVSGLLVNMTQETWGSPSTHVRLPNSGLLALGMNGYMPWLRVGRPAAFQQLLRILGETSQLSGVIPWHIALQIASEYVATDPRDHIYGLLGVTGLEIKPDYTSKSAADVFRDFACGFLEASRNMPVNSPRLPGCPLPSYSLRFLSCAGIGRYEYEPGMPTWAPNFAHERNQRRQALVPLGCQKADMDVFSERDGYATVIENSLYVPGVLFERIDCVFKPPSETKDVGTPLLRAIHAYRSRHKTYPSGIPTLQAFFRLLKRDVSMNVDKTTVRMTLGFLENLLASGRVGIFGALFALGYPINWEFETMRQALDALAEDIEQWFVESFFPGMQLKDFGLEGVFARWWNGEPMDQVSRLYAFGGMQVIHYYNIFETPLGFLGLAPRGGLPGDIVCVLKDCGVPVILRKVDSHYLFVGTAFVLGLMDGEARRFVEGGLKVPEVLEIR